VEQYKYIVSYFHFVAVSASLFSLKKKKEREGIEGTWTLPSGLYLICREISSISLKSVSHWRSYVWISSRAVG